MLYSEMNEKEQKKWRIEFVTFAKEQLPLLLKARSNWDPKFDAITIKALELINAFSYAQAFVKESFLYKDYARRISALEGYFKMINKELSSNIEDDSIHYENSLIPTDSFISDLSELSKTFLSVCKTAFINGIIWIKNIIIIIKKRLCNILK